MAKSTSTTIARPTRRRSLLTLLAAGIAVPPEIAPAEAAGPPIVAIDPTIALSGAINHVAALLLYHGSRAGRTAKVVQALEALSFVRDKIRPGHPAIDWHAMAAKGPRDLAYSTRFELEQARRALARWEKRLAAQEVSHG